MASTRSPLQGRGSNGIAGARFLIVFGLPFLLVAVLIGSLAASNWSLYARSQWWPKVPAIIESVELAEEVSDGSVHHHVECRYRYTYPLDGGRTHVSSRVELDEGSSTDPRHRRRFNALELARVKGTPVQTRVNPRRPSESILFSEVSKELIGLTFAAFMFFGAGAFLISMGVHLLRESRRRAKRLARDPHRPWRSDPRWETNCLAANESGKAAWVGWVVAVCWNAFLGLFWMFAFGDEDLPVWMLAMLGLFQLLGIALLWGAVVGTLRRRKYGDVGLWLEEMPVAMGRPLQGVIEVSHPIQAAEAEMVLLCESREKTTDGTRTKKLASITGAGSVATGPSRDGSGRRVTWIPVRLMVPEELPISSELNRADPEEARDGVHYDWILRVTASTAGVDFHASFNLPVARPTKQD